MPPVCASTALLKTSGDDIMLPCRSAIGAMAVAAALAFAVTDAAAFDETKYPDWSGQWARPRGIATQWEQGKPSGLGQQAPLTPEYPANTEPSPATHAPRAQALQSRHQ